MCYVFKWLQANRSASCRGSSIELGGFIAHLPCFEHLGIDGRRGGRCVGCPQAGCGSIECCYVRVVDGSLVGSGRRGRASWNRYYRCDFEGWIGDLVGRRNGGKRVVHSGDVRCVDSCLVYGSSGRCDGFSGRSDNCLIRGCWNCTAEEGWISTVQSMSEEVKLTLEHCSLRCRRRWWHLQ